MVKTNSVYNITPDDRYQFLTVSSSDTKYFLDNFTEGKKIENVKTMELSMLKKASKLSSFADFIGFFSGGILVRVGLREKLDKLFDGKGDWISMKFEGEELFYFNVTNYIDLLDETKTVFNEYQGQFISIRKLALKKLEDQSSVIFKLPKFLRLPPLVSDIFVDFVRDNELSGLIFEKKSEDGST